MENINQLLRDLHSSDSDVQFSALRHLETFGWTPEQIADLESRSPEEVRSFIVPLLLHQSPAIQTTAIRLLYRWDPDEALQHFRALLLGESPQERVAALTLGYFFPFSVVRPFLMQFLSLENDPELLKRAGWLFQVNPQPDLPLQLGEVWDTTTGSKRDQLGRVLLEVITGLSAAGLTTSTPQDFLQELRQTIRRLRLQAMLTHFQQVFDTGDRHEREGIVERMESFSHLPEVRNLLVRLLKQENDVTLRTRIALNLGLPAHSRHDPLPPTSATATTTATETPVSSPSPISLPESKDELYQQLQSGSDEEKGQAIRVLGAQGRPADVPKLRTFVTHSAPTVSAAAIDALRESDSEWLAGLLPKLVQSIEPRVREAAIRAFIHCDKRQALTLVEQLLGSGALKQRSAGIFAMGFFDFPSVRELAAGALVNEENPEHQKFLGELFLTHLDEEGFLLLAERASALDKPEASPLPAFVRQAAATLHQKHPGRHPSPEEWIAQAQITVQERQERKKTPTPYSVESIKKLRAGRAAAPAPSNNTLDEIWQAGKHAIANRPAFPFPIRESLLIMIFLGASLFLLSRSSSTLPGISSPSVPAVTAGSPETPGTPLEAGQIRDVQGAVISVFADALRIQPDGQITPLHVRIQAISRPFKAGDAFRGRVKVEKVLPQRIEVDLVHLY